MENELNINNLRHIWTGYDSASSEYIIFKFNSLPDINDEIEYLDKTDDSVRKAKVENISTDDGYVSLDVYDYILDDYRSFKLEKGNNVLITEIIRQKSTTVKNTPQKISFALLLEKLFSESPEETQTERIRKKIQKAPPEHTLNLLSPHHIDECCRRLEDAVDAYPGSFFSSKLAAGNISATHIEIRKQLKPFFSIPRIFTAVLEKNFNGTLINGFFQTHDSRKSFKYIWVISCMISFVIFWGLISIKQLKGVYFWVFALVPVLEVFCIVGSVKFGKFLSRNEPAFLKNFLIELLDAEEIQKN